MSTCYRLLFFLSLSVLYIHTATAQISTCGRSKGEAYLDVNSVRARLVNTGGLFYRGEPHVYNVPRFTNGNSIFASGIWVAGEVQGELRGAASRYGEWELWAGPLDENGNPPADCTEYDRIYLINIEDVALYDEAGIATADLLQWPWELGAPVIDGDGNPDNYNLEGGDRPEILGHQTAWWVMNDRGNIHESTGLPPMGLEVQVTAFAANSEIPAIRDATLYKYKLINKSGEPVENAYFGMWSDPDLGDFSDDYVGSDTLLNLAYVYNADNEDAGGEGYGTPPPALGYDFIQGPLVNDDGIDNDGDGMIDETDERQGMNAFMFYYGGGGVYGDPQVGMDYYLLMQGRWKDGSNLLYRGDGATFGTTDRPTRYMYSGDPITLEGWTERNPGADGTLPPNSAGDRRFIASTGPFSIAPGESQELVIAIVWAKGEDNWDSVRAMKEASEVVEEAYLDGFVLANLPVPEPNIKEAPATLSPGNFTQNQPLNPVLRWLGDSLAEGYEVHLSTTEDYSGNVIQYNTFLTEITPRNLEPFTTYHWRVRAANSRGNGPWSRARQFTTSGETVSQLASPIVGFLAVSNAAGPIDPPDMAAFAFNSSGFPILEGSLTPEGSYPAPDRPTRDVQQSTNESAWGIHTAGNNPLFSRQSRCSEDCDSSFVELVFPEGWGTAGIDDYEWRFTQSCLDRMDGVIEAGDCLARRAFDGGDDIEIPFELWNIGQLADSTDDYRLIPVICEEACETGLEPGVFDVYGDHPISGGSDDPFSDAVYWYKPEDTQPGEAGYLGYFAGESELGAIVFARMVLVEWNGGGEPPYEAELPEPGTVFRIVTASEYRPPILSAPGNGANTSIFGTELYWASEVPAYQLQIDTAPDFIAPVIDTTGTGATGFVFDQPQPDQTYYWRVRTAIQPGDLFSDWSETWLFTPIVSGVATEEESPIPINFVLEGNYPNPFTGSTRIRYALPIQSPVRLEVFDVLGRRVAILANEIQDAGWHEAEFDTGGLRAGLYLYRLTAGLFSASKTMVLVH